MSSTPVETVESTNDTNKIYLPLPPPDTLHSENPQATLTESEKEMYDAVFAHFTATGYGLPGFEEEESANEKEGYVEGERRKWTSELIEEERFWLSYECILRFLRASKWKTQVAIHRLESTLKWKREFGVYDLITNDLISIEGETGKAVLFGFDAKGRPAYYMIPSRQNTEEGLRQIQYVVWLLERCIDLMPPGVENLAILINFASKAKSPSLGTARAVLNILQDHYPERMGVALVINVPFLVNAFFKLIMPFVDPVTREKVKFNPRVIEDGFVAKDSLMKEWWGGDHDLEYEHEKFFPALVKMASERKERWMEKWKGLGGVIGIKEWEYKA
ncbi:CRAL-TRIO domain-containing protein C23B6.04c [Leucoagaricus sp. SymC.cos]|nr:CRAL-TRIO domain-containing protein C23B6.04c [Leucoagaricus sp. SymC.cos]